MGADAAWLESGGSTHQLASGSHCRHLIRAEVHAWFRLMAAD